MESEKNEVVVTNKNKMDELMKLLEELVINKIRIEKIKQGISSSEYQKILDQEILIVSKVQEVVKKIQTNEIEVVYKKLSENMKNNSMNTQRYVFEGENAEFDSSLEAPVIDLLTEILAVHEQTDSRKILVSAVNNSSNIIIQIVNCNEDEIEECTKNIYENEHISLTYVSEDVLKSWLSKTSLSDFTGAFQNLRSSAKMLNAAVELESEKQVYKKASITIPYSSSITKAQFVKLADLTFAIPVEYIDKIINSNIVKIEKSNGRDFIKHMDRIIPIILIDKKLDLVVDEEYLSYVVLSYNDQMKALPINLILEQSDIVIRPKPQAISEISEYKGVAILDDGNVTIVLDVPSLVQASI